MESKEDSTPGRALEAQTKRIFAPLSTSFSSEGEGEVVGFSEHESPSRYAHFDEIQCGCAVFVEVAHKHASKALRGSYLAATFTVNRTP
jgi:hypothetical protein